MKSRESDQEMGYCGKRESVEIPTFADTILSFDMSEFIPALFESCANNDFFNE